MSNAVEPGRRTAPRTLKRKIAAILAADVAGYSRLVAEAEERTLHDLAAARDVFAAVVDGAGGRIFNTAGDSIMCEFDSAVEAVRAAIDIQTELASRNAGIPLARRLEFRIGITIGDVVERDGDLLGDGVNIAARLESLSPAGGICVSRSVHEAVAGKVEVPFRDLGNRQVKNIPQAVQAFVIEPPPVEAPPAPGVPDHPESPRRRGSLLLVSAGIAVAACLGAGAFLLQSGFQPERPAPEVATAPVRRADSATFEAASPARPADQTKPSPAPSPARLAASPSQTVSADDVPVADLYLNARQAEARGDRTGGLKLYAALAPRAKDSIDVALRYAGLIQATRNAAAARVVMADLARAPGFRAAGVVEATLAGPDERRIKLDAIVASDPDYAPAAYLLGEDYLSGRPGGPTLTERRLAFESFDSFMAAEADGKAARFFLDRNLHGAWVEAARKRRAELEAFFSGVASRPTATFSRTETGFAATLTLPEPATAISTRLGERGDFVSTGSMSTMDPKTGRPAPNPRVAIPPGAERTTLYVTYLDRTGQEAGPFPIPFDEAAVLVSAGRDTLERFPESWIRFRPDLPNVLSYAQLVSNRCAISRALIGFGDDPPRQPLALPPCDSQKPSAIPSDARPFLSLPDGVDSVQIQIAYADGSESQVRTFRR